MYVKLQDLYGEEIINRIDVKRQCNRFKDSDSGIYDKGNNGR